MLVYKTATLLSFQIAKDIGCDFIAASTALNQVYLSDNAFANAGAKNINTIPSMKWQYFGSKEGVTTVYPARRSSSCFEEDSRFRCCIWYLVSFYEIKVYLEESESIKNVSFYLFKM